MRLSTVRARTSLNLFTIFAVLLGAVTVGIVLVLLGIGFFLSFVFAVACIVLLGALNYFLWGRAMEPEVQAQQVSEERNPLTGYPMGNEPVDGRAAAPRPHTPEGSEVNRPRI